MILRVCLVCSDNLRHLKSGALTYLGCRLVRIYSFGMPQLLQLVCSLLCLISRQKFGGAFGP